MQGAIAAESDVTVGEAIIRLNLVSVVTFLRPVPNAGRALPCSATETITADGN
jgi:hypothetical protein